MPTKEYKKPEKAKKKPKFKIVPRKKKEEEKKKEEKPKPKKKMKFKVVPRKQQPKKEVEKPKQPTRKAPERKKPEKPKRKPPARKEKGKAPNIPVSKGLYDAFETRFGSVKFNPENKEEFEKFFKKIETLKGGTEAILKAEKAKDPTLPYAGTKEENVAEALSDLFYRRNFEDRYGRPTGSINQKSLDKGIEDKSRIGERNRQQQKWLIKHKSNLLSYGRGQPSAGAVARNVDSREEYDYVVGKLSGMYGSLGSSYTRVGNSVFGKREPPRTKNFDDLEKVSVMRYGGGTKGGRGGGTMVFIDSKSGEVYDSKEDFDKDEYTGNKIMISRGRGKKKLEGLQLGKYRFGKNLDYGYDYGYIDPDIYTF